VQAPEQAPWFVAAALFLAGAVHAAARIETPPDSADAAGSTPCADSAGRVAVGTAQWNGWGRDFDNSRYQPEPAIRATDVHRLAPKWAFGIGGTEQFGQPAIVDGRLFVTSSGGRVYSLDSGTGCTYWSYDVASRIRTGVSIGALAEPQRPVRPKKSKLKLAHLDVLKAPSAAFFGDDSGTVYALDAQKGTLLWKAQVDTHPLARIAGTPVAYQNRLYVVVSSDEEGKSSTPGYGCCTFRGSVVALDIATGHLLWKTYTVTEEAQAIHANGAGAQQFGPAGAPIASAPTIDAKRGALYVSTGNSYTGSAAPMADAIVALDLIDGKIRWIKQLPLKDNAATGEFDSPPILRSLAGDRQIILAAQKSGRLYGLDPDRVGEILWGSDANEAGAAGTAGVVESGAAADHRNLYVAVSVSPPLPDISSGSLWAVDINTGARRWRSPAPSPPCSWTDRSCSHVQSQAVTVMPGIAFSGSMDGHLRAYSTIDGKVVWDFDTAKDYETVNRIKARGGSLAEGGAAIVNGIVYVTSGDKRAAGQPGNVLLAFSVNGK
jgi:polyvinyl alcohol dehydrogenase (cytochrome)